MKILKHSGLALAALVAFSGCNQSSADSPTPVVTLPVVCPNSGLVRYQLPIYWGQPDSPTFTYTFQIQPATEGDSPHPVGIVLPGGAGAPSIGYPRGTIFPPNFHVIYTDVRGAGCNLSANFPPEALTSEYFARDVLSIVRFLGLGEYVLFGISYGTVHATVMTNIAQREGIQAPTALVLEGILGTWKINAQEVVDYNREWARVKATLPASVVSEFQMPSPYGISSGDWMTLLDATLNAGTTPQNGNNTYFFLNPLRDPITRPAALAAIQDKIAEIKRGYRPDTVRLATILHCTETTGSVYAKDLVNGEIVNTGPDLCPLLGLSHDRPYDSVNYPVSVPIYYFEGSADPNTSPANAGHHFNSQTQANRYFTLVWEGGHTDMSGTLHQLPGCTAGIFTAIARNPSGFQAALDQCPWPKTLFVRPAGS